jgi:hypothetical protein
MARIRVRNDNEGDLSVPWGLPIQQIFEWLHQNSISSVHSDLVKATFPNQGTPRDCTSHAGFYQSVGLRCAFKSSSSLREHPDCKTSHFYWNWKMNSGLFPFTMQLRNKLAQEAHSVAVSCGNVIGRLLSVEAAMNNRTDFGGLVTINYDKTIHTDEDWLSDDLATIVKQSISRLSATNIMCERLKHNMEYYSPGRIPQSTTVFGLTK